MYSSIPSEYENLWKNFQNKYHLKHLNSVKYLKKTYIRFYRRRFLKCYINQVLHFETITIFRGKGSHAVLKRQLKSSTDDLKTVINAIKLLLTNQTHEHTLVIAAAKIRFFSDLRFSIFQQLVAYITVYALRKIAAEYKKIIEFTTALLVCTENFIASTGLPCSHKIQNRMFDDKTLKLKDVHLHWKSNDWLFSLKFFYADIYS